MKDNIITHIYDTKLSTMIHELIEEFDLMELDIHDFEEFFHVILHVNPKFFIVEINTCDDPYLKVIKIIKKSHHTKRVPIIVVSKSQDPLLIERISKLDISGFIYPPVIKEVLRLNIHNTIKQYEHLDELESSQDIQAVQTVMISSLASLAEYRDPETGEHIKRTQNYVKALAVTLKKQGYFLEELTDDNIDVMYMSAPLHDIGKVGIRDDILLKPGRLTKEEFEIMKTHTTLGYEAIMKAGNKLKNSDFLNYAADVAYSHHEKYDGSGYPRGLKGEDIPLIGRLMAVADVFDALISKRVYKEAMSQEQAMDIIVSEKGTHFDPVIVDCLLAIKDTFKNISEIYSDTKKSNDVHQLKKIKLRGQLQSILIVEDSRIVRLVLRNQLVSLGFDVDEAKDGIEGLRMLEAKQYDLILLDIEMPRMNGYEMMNQAYKTYGSSLPIALAMTSEDYTVTKEKLRGYGIEALMLKPIDLNVLAETYESVYKRRYQ